MMCIHEAVNLRKETGLHSPLKVLGHRKSRSHSLRTNKHPGNSTSSAKVAEKSIVCRRLESGTQSEGLGKSDMMALHNRFMALLWLGASVSSWGVDLVRGAVARAAAARPTEVHARWTLQGWSLLHLRAFLNANGRCQH